MLQISKCRQIFTHPDWHIFGWFFGLLLSVPTAELPGPSPAVTPCPALTCLTASTLCPPRTSWSKLLSGWDHFRHYHSPDLTTKSRQSLTATFKKFLWDGQSFSKELGSSYFRIVLLCWPSFWIRNKPSTFTRHTKSQINLYQHVNFTGSEKKWPLSRNGFSTFAITALAFH